MTMTDIVTGGTSMGRGYSITWQDGPIGLVDDVAVPNGAFPTDVLDAVQARLELLQESQAQCNENAVAIACIKQAVESLNCRQVRRECEGMLGSHI
jgi:hypothetical protein